MMHISRTRLIAPLFVVAGLALASGCGGQGKFTREGTSLAKERMNVMKSATEWEMAKQAFLAGDLDKALRKIDTSLSVNPQVAKSHVLKGRILMERGEVGLALRSLETALAIDPNSVDAHYYTGLAYERLTKSEEALSHYRAAGAIDPYNDQYVLASAEMLIDMGRNDEATRELRESPTFDHSAGVRQTLGHIALIEKRVKDAETEFQAARLLAPEDMDILEDMTQTQYFSGRYADAAYGLNVLLSDEAHQDRRDLLRMQAECMVRLNRISEARAAYMSLTEDAEGTNDADAWIGLGNVSFTMGDFTTLRRAATRVVAIDPDRKEGYVLWTLLHREQDNAAGALRSIEDAIARDPVDPALQTMRALVLLDLGQPDRARASLASALKLDPNNVPAKAVLARVNQTLAEVQTP